MSAAEVNNQFQLIQRNWRNKHDWAIKEEIRFYLEPHPLFVYDGRETFDDWNVVNCVITDRDNVASIELEMIANRYLWIDYRAGLEERARLLAHHLLTAPVLPTEINYITPRGDFINWKNGHWRKLVDAKDLEGKNVWNRII